MSEVNWREDKSFMQFLDLEFGPAMVRKVRARGLEELPSGKRLYRSFYAGRMSAGGGNRKTLAQLYQENNDSGDAAMSAEEFWRLNPNPTLQDRIDYLEHCYAVDPISRDTRIQLAKQIEDLKAQLRKREGNGAKK